MSRKLQYIEMYALKSIEETVTDLSTLPKEGLSTREAAKRIEKFGYNEIPENKQITIVASIGQ